MAKFNYKVQDALGNFRSGTLEARDFKDARSIIERRGFKVIELAPVSSGLGPPPPLEEPPPLEAPPPVEPKNAPLGPPPQLPPEPTKAPPAMTFKAPEIKPIGNIEILAKDTGSRFHTGPAPRRGYRPPLGERILSLLPPVQVSRGIGAIIAAIGLIWLVASWTRPESTSTGSTTQVAQNAPQKFKLRVLGSVEVKGSLGDVELRVDLPDIPYQQTFHWAKIEHPRPGHFVIEVEFESTRKARQVILTARKPGLGEAVLPAQPIAPEGGELRAQVFHIPSLPK
jgi:hypothetical protein